LKTLEINKRSFGEDHVRYARSLENLSNVLNDLGDYKGAIERIIKALEINKRNFGEDHVIYASSF
jgi:tetratricopeptide (TPR) repeat protein